MADDEVPEPEPLSFTINGVIPVELADAAAIWSVMEPPGSWQQTLAQAVLDQVGYEPAVGHQIQVRFLDDKKSRDLWLPSAGDGGWVLVFRSSDGVIVVKDTDTGDSKFFAGKMMFRPDRELRRSTALNAAIEAGVPFI
jgi:hypothetical protein